MPAAPATPDLERLGDVEHEDVAVIRRRGSGLHAVIAVHSTVLGPALGGVRFHPYASFDEAVHDVLRLSRGMTSKAALAGLDQGGAKAVILGHPDTGKSPALLDDFADAVDALGGRYTTAEDVGTSQDDMDRLRGRTRHVGGTSEGLGGSGDPSPSTALGVVYAMEAAATHRWGTDLADRTVLVSGAGKVGSDVIRLLVARGARVTASEPDAGRVAAALEAGAVGCVEPAHALATPADIFAPCALGGVLTAGTAAMLPFRVIVGAANNQLRSPDVADRLAAAGVLYVPDYLANAGGIINIAEEAGGYDRDRARAAVERIRGTAHDVLERAERLGITPVAAADQIVAERFEAARPPG